jgi:hypothetical protein
MYYYTNAFGENKHMSKMVILDNEYFTLWYHPEAKIVHHQVHKFVYGEKFRTMLTTGTETMRKYGATKWLSDDRTNTVLRKEDTQWGQANWFPQTVQAGWKYSAIVLPMNAIGKESTEKEVQFWASQGITARHFTNPEEALKWLENIKA